MTSVSSPSRLRQVGPWLLFGATVALTLAGVVLMVVNRDTANAPDSFAYVEIEPLLSLAFASIGLVLTLRLPRNAVGWLFCATGVLSALNTLSHGYATHGLFTNPGSIPFATFAAWARNWLWLPLAGMAEVFLLLLFPDGRLLPRFRYVARIAVIALLVAIVGVAFEGGELEGFPPVVNPAGVSGDFAWVMTALKAIGILAVVICTVLGALSQLIRYRSAGSDERHQIKWFAAASALVAIAFALQSIHFAPTTVEGEPPIGRDFSKVLEASLLFAIMSIPIATGIAVLRYRLYDIDIIINRTLVYVPLTAILAGLFVALTGLLRAVFAEATEAGSDVAIALSTLAVVAVLTPAKNQLQALVDHHFKEAQQPGSELNRVVEHARFVLQVLEVERFAEEFLEKARSDFGASSAELVLRLPNHEEYRSFVGDNALASWPLRLSLQLNEMELGHLRLGPKVGGRGYTEAETRALEKATSVLMEVARVHLHR